jgi:hypothetical protein
MSSLYTYKILIDEEEEKARKDQDKEYERALMTGPCLLTDMRNALKHAEKKTALMYSKQ